MLKLIYEQINIPNSQCAQLLSSLCAIISKLANSTVPSNLDLSNFIVQQIKKLIILRMNLCVSGYKSYQIKINRSIVFRNNNAQEALVPIITNMLLTYFTCSCNYFSFIIWLAKILSSWAACGGGHFNLLKVYSST